MVITGEVMVKLNAYQFFTFAFPSIKIICSYVNLSYVKYSYVKLRTKLTEISAKYVKEHIAVEEVIYFVIFA